MRFWVSPNINLEKSFKLETQVWQSQWISGNMCNDDGGGGDKIRTMGINNNNQAGVMANRGLASKHTKSKSVLVVVLRWEITIKQQHNALGRWLKILNNKIRFDGTKKQVVDL